MGEQETPEGWRRLTDEQTGNDCLAKIYEVNDLKHAYRCLLNLQELVENASENTELDLYIDSEYLMIHVNTLGLEELNSKHIKLAEDINSKLEAAPLSK